MVGLLGFRVLGMRVSYSVRVLGFGLLGLLQQRRSVHRRSENKFPGIAKHSWTDLSGAEHYYWLEIFIFEGGSRCLGAELPLGGLSETPYHEYEALDPKLYTQCV